MKNNEKKLFVLVGLPGAGKSTLRKSLILADPSFAILSSDDYIEEEARRRGETYNAVFPDTAKAADLHIRTRLIQLIGEDANIIWDQTNLTEKKRERILHQIPRDYWKIAVYIEISETLRQTRIANRPGKTIPMKIDVHMRSSYVRPTLQEGFDEILSYPRDFI